MRRWLIAVASGVLCLPLASRASTEPPPAVQSVAVQQAVADAAPETPVPLALAGTRSGREIFGNFLTGRADAGCAVDQSSRRWEQHFSHAPGRLANEDDEVLPLFGYVVDELREAGLPTEFALIPFVESGYRPGARNGSGPAGLWQFIATTARNHQVAVGKAYDGRLSAVDSTAAAIRYLKTLYGMFGGDWRLTIMAYNAGEYRVLQSMRRAGMNAQNARPAELPGLSAITYAYVEKLHALACVLDHAQNQGGLMSSLDRAVPILAEHPLPAGTAIGRWAQQRELEPSLVSRLNPAVGERSAAPHTVLAPRGQGDAFALAQSAPLSLLANTSEGASPDPDQQAAAAGPLAQATRKPARAARSHTVRSGESAWSIAKRYGVPVKTLLSRNGLSSASVLKPGMVLAFDAQP